VVWTTPLADHPGFEPGTIRLTVERSAVELVIKVVSRSTGPPIPPPAKQLTDIIITLSDGMSIDMKENIKTISKIISKEEADFFINYIDSNIHKFSNYQSMNNPNRYVWRFGVDEVYQDSNPTLEDLSDIKETLTDLFDRIICSVKEAYNDEESLYITSFHLGKQLPGAVVAKHLDAGPNDNGHFKYSFILYLNSNDDGSITFDSLDYSYKPQACDAISFPSQGEEYEHEVSKITNERYSLPVWITNNSEWALSFA